MTIKYFIDLELSNMKRVLSLILVLVLCACLPLTAFAAESSPPDTAPTTDGPSQTGDTASLGLWAVIMVVALLAAVVATVFYRKSLKK